MHSKMVEKGALQKQFFSLLFEIFHFFVKRHISVVPLFQSEKLSRIVWIASNFLHLEHEDKMF